MPLIRRRLSVRYRRRSMRRSRMSNYRRLRRRYRSRAIITTRGIRGAMMKWLDWDFYQGGTSTDAAVPCTNTGYLTPLNIPNMGDAFNERNGYRIKLLYLDIQLYLQTTNNATVQKANDLIRFCIVYDRQPNGVLPNVSDIFADNLPASTTSYPSLSHFNLLNKDRFLILADKRKFLQEYYDGSFDTFWQGVPTIGTTAAVYPAPVAAPGGNKFIRKNIKLRGLETLYRGSSTPPSIGDISTGALYLYSSGLLAPIPNPGHVPHAKYCLSGMIRLKFVDA